MGNDSSSNQKPVQKNKQDIITPVIKKVHSIENKQAWRRLQNIAATKKYILNKKEKEKAVQQEIENVESRNRILKSQVAGLEQKIDTITKLMLERKILSGNRKYNVSNL